MCHGYRGSADWWDEAVERRRLEVLEQQERESRETLRARQDEELRRLEKALSAEKPKVGSKQ